MRETAFVEIGPVTAFHRDTFATLLPFPDVGMGWGLDVHWAAVGMTEKAGDGPVLGADSNRVFVAGFNSPARARIPVSGMHCHHCVSRVEAALARVPGVRDGVVVRRDGGLALPENAAFGAHLLQELERTRLRHRRLARPRHHRRPASS